MLRSLVGERAFKATTLSIFVFLIVFVVGVIVSLLAYTDWKVFTSVLFSPEILLAIRLSLVTATVSTIISVLIAIPVAYTISQRSFPGKDLVDSLLDLPIVISPIALGAVLLVFFNTPLGAGIDNHIIKFVFAVPGIILAQIAVIIALAIRLLKSTFDSIDIRYEQVGRTLGYNKPEVFFKVTLPLARNGLIAATILTWARAIGEFGATVTLAGATPMKTETLPVAIFLSLSSANIEKAVAVIFVLILIAVVALLIMRKITGRRFPI